MFGGGGGGLILHLPEVIVGLVISIRPRIEFLLGAVKL